MLKQRKFKETISENNLQNFSRFMWKNSMNLKDLCKSLGINSQGHFEYLKVTDLTFDKGFSFSNVAFDCDNEDKIYFLDDNLHVIATLFNNEISFN